MKKYTKKTLPPEEDDIPWQSGKNPFVPEQPTRRPKKKLPIERKPIERINANPFHATGVEKAEVNVISKKRYNTDMDVFKTEWAITEPTKRPHDWLMEEKGYTLAEARDFINSCGGVADWDKERLRIQNKALGHVIKRHVDSLVEVNEIHIKSSKLVNARALEMLSNNYVEFIDKDGNKRQSPLRPSDLHNIVNVVERAQFIYRRAMGLPNDDGGLQQVLARLEAPTNQTINIQNNTNTNTLKIDESVERQLSYDDLMEIVRMKREQRRGLPNSEDIKNLDH